MDDGPRIGALQLLLAMVGGMAAYLAVVTHAWPSFPIAAAGLGGLAWLEVYARRRARAEREERERRRRRSSIAHLDFDARDRE